MIAELKHQPEPQPAGPRLKEIEEVDESVVWQSNPEDYKLDQLDQYEKPYLIKIVNYLHEQIKKLNGKVETGKTIHID